MMADTDRANALRKRPTASQIRQLAYLIKCEDDYLPENVFYLRFADAVLALWGAGGYVHTHKPNQRQLNILDWE
jgi:hypothetical protein